MEKLRINKLRILDSLERLRFLDEDTNRAIRYADSNIGRDFSPVAGLSEAGEIHGQAISRDPASAKASLEKFSGQLPWVRELLEQQVDAVRAQDSGNAQGLDISDMGGTVGETAMPIINQPEPGYSPFSFVQPVVMLGPSLDLFSGQYSQTKFDQAVALAGNWSELKSRMLSQVESLNSIAGSLESEHDSDFTFSAARKVREMAGHGQQFAANAELMSQKAFRLAQPIPVNNLGIMGDVKSMRLIPDVAAQKAFETVTLAKWQQTINGQLTGSLPEQQKLMDAPIASGGGGQFNIGLGQIAGLGERYTTEDETLPREIQQAFEEGVLVPGSFEMVDGELRALERVDQGLVDEVNRFLDQRTEELYGGGRLQEYINNGMRSLEETSTQAANYSGTAGGSRGGFTPNDGLNAGSGVGAGTGTGAVSGFSGQGRNSGFTPGQGVMNAFGGLGSGTSADGPREHAGAARGSAAGGGRAASGGAESTGRGVGGDRVNERTGGGAGAGTAQATPDAGPNANNAQNNGRGTGPMMTPGAAGQGQDRKKRGPVKSVMSRVELDKNRRDLLGDPKPALPGPIGDWARH
ncbi:hypothetical protein ACG98H_06305 [Corynebacterium sp. L4756]|uniref:hypothetical protein n=1 Tax=unclassified Corynebacterium TaxID=2624378 RepID=UPI00374C9A53